MRDRDKSFLDHRARVATLREDYNRAVRHVLRNAPVVWLASPEGVEARTRYLGNMTPLERHYSRQLKNARLALERLERRCIRSARRNPLNYIDRGDLYALEDLVEEVFEKL